MNVTPFSVVEEQAKHHGHSAVGTSANGGSLPMLSRGHSVDTVHMGWLSMRSPIVCVADTPHGLEVSIPAVRSWWGIAFLPFWLTIWALGWGFTAYGLVRSTLSPFEILWLILWTFAGAMAFSWWLWLVSGREKVIIDGVRLRLRREVCGFARERSYELGRVRNIRFSPPVAPDSRWGEALPLFVFNGSVAFDVDAEGAKRFGMYLDEEKSLALVRTIRERFPSVE